MRVGEDEYFLQIAEVVSQRSTCSRRAVGCVLVNEHKHVIGTGYNGLPRGMPHCIDTPCAGALSESGKDLDKCESIHAEINALVQCPNTEAIRTIYLTVSPCVHCVKALANTSAEHLVFREPYADWLEASKLWIRAGKTYENKPRT